MRCGFGAEDAWHLNCGPGVGGGVRARGPAADVQFQVEVVDMAALKAVVPRGQLVAVARQPSQPHPDTILAGPGHVVLLEDPDAWATGRAVVQIGVAGAAAVMTTGHGTRGARMRCAGARACSSPCPSTTCAHSGQRAGSSWLSTQTVNR